MCSMEFDILYALQEIHNPILDCIMVFVSTITNHGELWIAIGLILLCFKSTRKTGFVVLTALLLMLIISNLILKNLIMRDRPCWIDTAVELLVKCPDSYSFPSGHTASGFAAAISILMYHKKGGILAVLLAATIAFSRMYLFVHFPTDILGGIIIGSMIAIAARWIVKYMYKDTI